MKSQLEHDLAQQLGSLCMNSGKWHETLSDIAKAIDRGVMSKDNQLVLIEQLQEDIRKATNYAG